MPRHLVAQPLVEAVERRGGLGAVAAARGLTKTDKERLRRSFYRALESGTLTVAAADELAVHLLGEHPSMIFGPDFFSESEPVTV